MSVRETAHAMVDGFGSNARAFVQVQNGCDHRCTFCIIPYGRGPSRSVPAGEVVAQVRRLVEAGYAEVVLTGVDITSYGADLPAEMTLGKLVRHILKHVPELARLRLSSIDQVEADAHLMAAIADEPRLMPHLHLSLQSGDDMILKRMKRRHCREDAVRFCAEARRLRPDIVFGADLIAGFPTETEAMFANSLQPGRRLRADLPARVSVLAAQGHAGRAHAAGGRPGGEGAGGAAAAAGRGGARRSSRPASGLACRAADRARAARAHARLCRTRARRSGHTRHAGRGPRHWVHRKAVARGAACDHVCGVTDKPAKSRGLFSAFRRSAEPAPDAAVPDAAADPADASPEPAPAKVDAPTEPAPKQGWFQRLKAGLTKTSAKLSQDIAGIFTKRKLDADTLQELEDLLIQADLGVETAARISAALAKGRFDKEIATEEVRAVLAAEVERALAPVAKPLRIEGEHKPHVILVTGVNGTGKTTTIGKLAHRLRGRGPHRHAGRRRHLPCRGRRAAQDLGCPHRRRGGRR